MGRWVSLLFALCMCVFFISHASRNQRCHCQQNKQTTRERLDPKLLRYVATDREIKPGAHPCVEKCVLYVIPYAAGLVPWLTHTPLFTNHPPFNAQAGIRPGAGPLPHRGHCALLLDANGGGLDGPHPRSGDCAGVPADRGERCVTGTYLCYVRACVDP